MQPVQKRESARASWAFVALLHSPSPLLTDFGAVYELYALLDHFKYPIVSVRVCGVLRCAELVAMN